MLPAIYGDIVTGAQLKSSSHISNYQERILKEMCGELMTLDRHLLTLQNLKIIYSLLN
jgi:hypothetical protein